MTALDDYQDQLTELSRADQQRAIPPLHHDGRYIVANQQRLINVSSNDYLGLAADNQLIDEFWQTTDVNSIRFSASSSRLLTGNNEQTDGLEQDLVHWFHLAVSANGSISSLSCPRAALVFNSGYHANVGLLPALTKLPLKTLILADKLVHASIIEGIQLSRCDYKRYRHNDHHHLRQLLAKANEDYERIIIVTESLFSMDGDFADLKDLVTIKRSDERIELYVDEAHAVGAIGHFGLGLAEQTATLTDIDYLIGTFGKAMASMGAYVLCHPTVRLWLINTMRPLIYSTALPPINHAWSRFILSKMPLYTYKRARLARLSAALKEAINQISSNDCPSDSHIVPYILGSNAAAINKATELREAGFYALPIRPPTVPKGSARIRLVLNAAMDDGEHQALIAAL